MQPVSIDVQGILERAEQLAKQAKFEQSKIVDVSNSTLGELVTAWFKYKEETDSITSFVKQVKEYQSELEQQIIEKMRAEDMDKISTKAGSFTLAPKSMPSVEDMYSFIKWVAEDIDNRIGFLQKKVNDKAVNEMLEEEGALPPGVKTYMEDKLNKRKSK